MTEIFTKIIQMSMEASMLIGVITVLRALLHSAPKNYRLVLWAMAGVRLVCPFSLASSLSLVPEVRPGAAGNIGAAVQQAGSNTAAVQPGASDAGKIYVIAAAIWAAGVCLMALWAIVSGIIMRRRVRASVRLQDGCYACDGIVSAFVLGLVRPRIYLPSGLSEQARPAVVAHERAHISRLDHVSKPLGYCVLALHWFNPLVWAAYALFCRDTELACDERVIRPMDTGERREYCRAILSAGSERFVYSACHPAFGRSASGRVKAVLNYKKPTAWLLVLALAACVFAGACFLTSAPDTSIDSELDAFISQAIIERNVGLYLRGEFECEAHTVLGKSVSGDKITVYATAMYGEFSLQNGAVVHVSGGHTPIAITVEQTASGYKLLEYWEPSDGAQWVSDIREKFPRYAAEKAIGIFGYSERHMTECIRQAEEHFGAEYAADTYEAETDRTTRAVIAG